MTVEEDDRRRALLTAAQKRDMQRRHLDELTRIAAALDRSVREFELLIDDDVIDNNDFHLACNVESDLKAAAESVRAFQAHRRVLMPRVRLAPPPQLELPGLEDDSPRGPGYPSLQAVR